MHVDSLIVLELADGVCGICGRDVDPFGYTQPAHPSCNVRKGDRA